MFAVLAFSAFAATSAFAQEWLAGGLAIAAELTTNTEGLLVLIALNGVGGVLNEIDCSGLFEGDVGPKELNLVLDLFNLSGTLIEELSGTSLDCETTFSELSLGDCGELEEFLLWVDQLSLSLSLTWESLLELMAAGTEEFLAHFHNVLFEVLCNAPIIGNLEFLCEGLTSAIVDNQATDVLLLFTATSEEITCDTTNLAELVEFLVGFSGELLSSLTNGEVLAASV